MQLRGIRSPRRSAAADRAKEAALEAEAAEKAAADQRSKELSGDVPPPVHNLKP